MLLLKTIPHQEEPAVCIAVKLWELVMVEEWNTHMAADTFSKSSRRQPVNEQCICCAMLFIQVFEKVFGCLWIWVQCKFNVTVFSTVSHGGSCNKSISHHMFDFKHGHSGIVKTILSFIIPYSTYRPTSKALIDHHLKSQFPSKSFLSE